MLKVWNSTVKRRRKFIKNILNDLLFVFATTGVRSNLSTHSQFPKLYIFRYARVLRPLRNVAKVFVFRPISQRTLCRRLLTICRAEHLHIDMQTLGFLTTITHNDIRYMFLLRVCLVENTNTCTTAHVYILYNFLKTKTVTNDFIPVWLLKNYKAFLLVAKI